MTSPTKLSKQASFTVSLPFEDPFSSVIENLMAYQFPGTSVGNPRALLEALTTEVVGTKQHRFGPSPSPERLVTIRQVLSEAIAADAPIPIVVPWGGSKQGHHGVDIADMMALKQISCLQTRVKNHYEPGAHVIVRVEDLTDNVLFQDDHTWAQKTERYTADILKLIRITGYPITGVPESTLMFRDEFAGAVHAAEMILFTAITAPESREVLLRDLGWTGDLPQEQIDYYRKAYAQFYPNKTRADHDKMIARYFAAAWSRKQLRGSGALPTWQRWLTLGFSPPVPGASDDRRLFYRTIPERFTHQHRAPWIGKGYVKIRGREAVPAIAGWDGDGLSFNTAQAIVAGHSEEVAVETDYVVED